MGGSYFDVRVFDSDKSSSPSGGNTTKAKTVSKILVVDDSILVRKQISQILSTGGYNIAGHSANGSEAVEQYKQQYPHIDLVTMDTSMPGMDGLEALELILNFDKNAKVVMICALGKEELAEKALRLGALAYIIKPLHEDKVLETVSKAISAGLVDSISR